MYSSDSDTNKLIEFLAYLRSLDIQVVVAGDKLQCNAPEGTLTPQLRTQISQRKAEIIAFLQSTHPTTGNKPSLVPIARTRKLPLSFAQQRLWFLDRLVPNNPFYNVPAAFRLTGTLNLAALQQTFNQIVRRHEALRTNFVVIDGEAVQAIASLTISIPVIDLCHVPVTERDKQAQIAIAQEIQRPFNLSSEPLLRVTLLRLEQTEHILLLNLHHIISDGWSIGVLIREIAAYYTAFASSHITGNVSTPLPELPIQYADFAHWQREWLETIEQNGYSPLQTQLNYWRQQLNNISVLNLPTDRPRPAFPSYKGASQRLQLSKSLSAALLSFSQQAGVTLFMTMLTAFKILLYRYTQQEDISIGSPIANRNRSEIEGLIGFFVNSLVLRTDLSGKPTFRELLQRVKEVALAAYAHQDLPFEKLVEELHPERNLSQNPFFQVAFAVQNAPMSALELPDLTLHPQQLDTESARFDLEFHLWELSNSNSLWVDNSQGISGLVVYSTDLFDAATITRMLEHYQVLLENIINNPEKPITELELLTQAEQQLLLEWNNTQIDYPQDLCIHQLFEKQVEKNPDAVALVFADRIITYKELNIRSNQLAHYLQKQGVSTETLVAICLERSLDLVVGMLAILKAGGAYVPIDPKYPQERIEFMLEDAKVPVLLTQASWCDRAPRSAKGDRLEISKYQTICLDTDWENISKESTVNPNNKVIAENLLYVIYTSGSTGRPKGVEIEHKGFLNLIFWQQKAFNISDQDKVTQLAGVAFDTCGWEIWPYLTAGASIYFPDDETRRSPELLHDWLLAKEITISYIPTPILERFFLLDWPNNTSLRIILTGGDKLNKYPLPAHPFKVINNYGPTETTVMATSGEILPENKTDVAPTIGRPIANTQVYILDKNFQPVPIGIPGELYISSNGLARGYLNRPELTADKFIPNPFIEVQEVGEWESRGVGEEKRNKEDKEDVFYSHQSPVNSHQSSKIYKTGDLVRYLSDGNIEFLGRIDDQIKIRGYRIELGEIETVLSQHPAVIQTVVFPQENTNQEKNLIAYVVLNTDNFETQEHKQQQLETEQIEQWQMLYEETYKQSTHDLDSTFNITGWNSSYTNQPIPAEQMGEWVNNQVAKILVLQPNHVLEIGCGTGLLLFKIAPYTSQYVGTDFSSVSLKYIEQQLVKLQLSQVKLQQKIATDFTEIEAQQFDTVILNSVVQYFPSIEYLIQVLESAIVSTTPGGFIFIGDVRNLDLLQAFHASVQLHQAEAAVTREQLQQRVQRQMFQETELVIEPVFFTALKQHFPQINDVQIQLLRGNYRNELTQFRYNVILHIKSDATDQEAQKAIRFDNSLPEQEKLSWLSWDENNLTLEKVQQLLLEKELEIIAITNIPNARVMAAVKTAEFVLDAEQFKTVSQIRAAVQQFQDAGIDPEQFWTLGEQLGYKVEITWSHSSTAEKYDVTFIRQEVNHKITIPYRSSNLRPWHTYANNPLQAKTARKLVPQLQQYLAQKLPDYMVPSAYVVLESLPLSANGKIDRRALPTPEPFNSQLHECYIAPQTAVEETLVKIWCEVLGVKQVGIGDNFFALGGHSLLATQLVSRVRDAFGIELPLRSVFEAPAIAPLAKVIAELIANNTQNQAPALVPISRESRRMKLSSLNKESK